MIAAAPESGSIIRGTGGLRKLRFQDPKSNKGKSGGYRVCYAYFEPYGIALLVQIYPKKSKRNLTAAECNQIREQLELFQQQLEKQPLS